MRSFVLCSTRRLLYVTACAMCIPLIALAISAQKVGAEPTPIQNSQVPDLDATYQPIQVPQAQANFYTRTYTPTDFGANPDQRVQRMSLAITPDLRAGVFNDLGFRLASVFRVNGVETPLYRTQGRCQPYIRYGTTNQVQYQCVGSFDPVRRPDITHFTLTTGAQNGQPGLFLKAERVLLFTPAPSIADPLSPTYGFGRMSDPDWTPTSYVYFLPFATTGPLSALDERAAAAPVTTSFQPSAFQPSASSRPVRSLW
ncbi:hypothetical protein [Leptolyngbya sp. FACHB-261]|uniref:hypothetical protein n=1 Tax=Leptolyngbya sp. FACHB-261 TaxID=2692806 RepID=UPI001684CDCF|nr:hypothetical protein [Leptolyngbya sp. FACHB-261]MBD2105104.1 hypothetical protein [Leptolyngbya sp. FACHB-261]